MHKENIRHIITSESRLYSICNLLSPVISHSRGRMIPLLDELYTHVIPISAQVSSVCGVLTLCQCSVFMLLCSA